MIKRLFILFFVLTWFARAEGQQLPLYSQYLYNRYLINPAVAGSDGYTSFNLTAREQWAGYSGAPRTVSLSGQARILKRGYLIRQAGSRRTLRPSGDGRVGIGGYLFSDRNGMVYRTGFQTSYAYHMWLQNSTQLSFGLALTGYHFKINERELNFSDPDDPWLNNELRRGIFVPDASFGIFVLNRNYSVGFSTEQLFGAAARFGDDAYSNFTMDRHYYLFATWSFYPAPRMEIQPSALVMMSEQVRPVADIGLSCNFDQSLWGGLAYRTSGAVIANFGVRYSNIYLGYSFDFTMQEIQRVTYGTHEITAALKFGDTARKYRWLDRY